MIFRRMLKHLLRERLENMSKTGIEYAIQSLNAPGIQGILETSEAINLAKKGNDKTGRE